ncbi:GH39 family glycosyl hydrolase [Pedobacter rhodius]|uniref:Glycoside hydrolase n=1 Tax=Pedobacter rhodius TaxID=3004098 RepID=A0ABT4KX15_9SPHI|nr:glycoside hydrolase [Pedobacter sp. SJ11]MCZ4223475.1 glycoside hydrolase [Pedobacter sp. SJ11]
MQRRKFIRNTFITTTGAAIIPKALLADYHLFPSDPESDVKAMVNANAAGKKIKHFWSTCVGAGRANEGLRASWLEQLKLSQDLCGFKYCRFHGLFHDDMFVYQEINRKAVYNWQYIDDLFDRMLDIGVKPFVELGFMPKDLSSNDTTMQFWWKAHISPPKDYAKWAALVSEFTKHCISRYGLNEVRTWYFEVWNEPNLRGFWLGTKAQYFELYKVSVKAIKAIDQKIPVGGPSTSNFVPDERFDGDLEDKSKHKTLTVKDINTLEWRAVWIKDFLIYCKQENLPVDFVSTHPYPTDWALDPMTGKGGGAVRKVNATKEDLTWLKKTIKESAYPNAEIHCTEWSSSPSSRDTTHDSLQAATFIIKANVESIGLADSLSYWTFSDIFEEKGGGASIFHGGFGLINFQGIVKPSFHAYRMLNRLGDEVIHQQEGIIITRNSKTKKITTLLYHYPAERKNVVDGNVEAVLNSGSDRKFDVLLSGLKAKSEFEIEILDKNNGFAYPKWKQMGGPEPPTREQTKALKKIAMEVKIEKTSADASGKLNWGRNLHPWDCVLLSER